MRFQLNGPRLPGMGYMKRVALLGASAGVFAGAALVAFLIIQAAWPDPRALPDPGDYALPNAEAQAATQTLQLNIGGARIAHLDITGVEAGKETGLTNVLEVMGPWWLRSSSTSTLAPC